MYKKNKNRVAYHGSQKARDLFDKITEEVFKKYGFSNRKIISDWPFIVGEKLAQFTIPQRIDFPHEQTTGGILYIAVSNPGLSLELQAQEGVIVDKLSTYFGYKAVERIRILIDRKAENLPEKIEKPIKQKIDVNEFNAMKTGVEEITDQKLKTALYELLLSIFEPKD